ncbi:MAG: choice-of-anchor D domain-containing protein [Candidatus Bipolaricaulota bacterium]|nr:choice-of-anchor D domain-containing protein [Candidatus Bipolaricaulota bacterium]MDW8031411.1 choice-of-anchor D domain-containing protein [Candidatus Bipolaricaulota bacterium]
MKRLVATAIGLFWWLVMIFETAALAQITVLGDNPLQFGDVLIGTARERTLVIRNDGLEELRLRISRPASDHFVLVGLAEGEAFLDAALRPGAIYVLAVRCVPRRVGIIEEILMITADREIRLLCNGIGPQFTFVMGDTLDFREVEVGRAVDRDIIIRNDGTENLRGTVTAPSAPFSLVRGEGAFDIPPGRTYTVTVRCAPTSRGIFRFPLEIRNLSSALEPTKIATLLCQGVGPEITLVWRRDNQTALDTGPVSGPHLTIDFGTVNLNEARDISFEIRNNGERVLQGTVNGPTSTPPFSVVNGGGSFTLNPGAVRTVTVRCHLRSPGGSTGTLTITAINDADESTKTIILACGRAIPDIDVSPMRVDFQGQEKKKITIRNTGAAPLMLRRVSIVQNPAAFRLLTNLLPNACKRFSCSLAPGQSIEFEVQARTHQSTTTGILRISSDDPDEPTVDILLQVMVGSSSSSADLDAESRRLEIRETKHALEFTLASAEVAELRVALYDLRGRKIVEASSRSGQLRLEMLDQQGKPLANGVYLYAITYQGADGSLLRDRVRKFVLLR